MAERALLPQHNRYDYVPLPERKDYSWPAAKRLAFCSAWRDYEALLDA